LDALLILDALGRRLFSLNFKLLPALFKRKLSRSYVCTMTERITVGHVNYEISRKYPGKRVSQQSIFGVHY